MFYMLTCRLFAVLVAVVLWNYDPCIFCTCQSLFMFMAHVLFYCDHMLSIMYLGSGRCVDFVIRSIQNTLPCLTSVDMYIICGSIFPIV